MKIQIDIDNEEVRNFSKGARDALKNQAKKRIDSIIKESRLIAEETTGDEAEVEITSDIVMRASATAYNAPSKKKKNVPLLVAKISAAISNIFVGWLFEPARTRENTIVFIVFIIVLATACISNVLQFILEEKE